MAKKKKNLVKLKCTKCNNINYWTRKNKKTVQRKLEFNKFCKKCKTHTQHKESK